MTRSKRKNVSAPGKTKTKAKASRPKGKKVVTLSARESVKKALPASKRSVIAGKNRSAEPASPLLKSSSAKEPVAAVVGNKPSLFDSQMNFLSTLMRFSPLSLAMRQQKLWADMMFNTAKDRD